MARLCLMASHGHPLGLAMNPELGSFRDCQPLLPSPGSRHNMVRLDTQNRRPHLNEKPWKPVSQISESGQLLKVDSTITRPTFIDVQDTHQNSILLNFGIAEHCRRYEKILKFLMSGSNEVEGGALDLSMLSDLIGIQTLTNNNIHPFAADFGAGVQPSVIFQSSEFQAQRVLLDLFGDLARRSEFTLDPDGQVSFTASNTELDIFSVVSEYHLSNNSTKWRKHAFLVPQFHRLACIETRDAVHESSTMLENATFTPLKSNEKFKLKPSPRKRNNKSRDRDLYGNTHFHACESLLSVMVDMKGNGKTAILSLKKSSPALPELLMQFSASIAGTGIAVIFSVLCNVAYSRVPFCASKLFSTGIGLGLVWLSRSVNTLRDTVIYISRRSGKLNVKEEELMTKLNSSVKEIYLRGATVMVVAVLRLA